MVVAQSDRAMSASRSRAKRTVPGQPVGLVPLSVAREFGIFAVTFASFLLSCN